ncbi:MAG TPA: sugar porter family MFS transporter [Bryobacteraceae bacterium]|nr:sugar porter family MFS transporter [Bryobacteraceae bacterium]
MKSALASTLAEKGSALYVYLVSVVAATSGLLFGFDIAVINGAIIFLREQFHLTEVQTEVAASSLLIGCVFGASLAGWMSDRFGRRRILMLSALLFTLSSLGAALPRNLPEFTAARFLGGIAIGMASVLAPLYIAEVSPARSRGRLVSLNQMAIVTGILLAYLVNWLLSFLGAESWRWMFATAAVPSGAFLVALFFVPESPRWLTENGEAGTALAVLSKVNGHSAALAEMEQIREAIAEETGSLAELLQPGLRRALFIAVALAILQQITGINTVLFYGSIIFREQVGNHSATSAIGANVIVGAINFLATIAALWMIDRLGRRPLLMLSSGVMALCQVALGAAFLIHPPPSALILTIMLFCVAAFAVGLGPGVWVVLAEIFPTRIRGRAMSIATISLWVACVALTMTFLSLVKAITATGAFWLYGAMCMVTCLIVWKATPETKGKSLEEIERLWRRVG